MHQIEVACLVRHGLPAPFFRDYLAELAERQCLIASATSEAGVGGDLRRSICAVQRHGTRFRIRKQAPVISYGKRRTTFSCQRVAPDAAPGDQVLVLVRKSDTRLAPTGEWDTLGMRGTRSLGFTLETAGAVDQILPVPFAEIASQTMLPTSHVLWTSLWLGLTSDAVSRARAFIRAEARRSVGAVPPGALRLAETVADLESMRATVHGGRADFERNRSDPEALAGIGFAIRMNNLKTVAARMAPEIVRRVRLASAVSTAIAATPVLGRTPSARRPQCRAHDQQRSCSRRERRHAPRYTRRIEVATGCSSRSNDRARVQRGAAAPRPADHDRRGWRLRP